MQERKILFKDEVTGYSIRHINFDSAEDIKNFINAAEIATELFAQIPRSRPRFFDPNWNVGLQIGHLMRLDHLKYEKIRAEFFVIESEEEGFIGIGECYAIPPLGLYPVLYVSPLEKPYGIRYGNALLSLVRMFKSRGFASICFETWNGTKHHEHVRIKRKLGEWPKHGTYCIWEVDI